MYLTSMTLYPIHLGYYMLEHSTYNRLCNRQKERYACTKTEHLICSRKTFPQKLCILDNHVLYTPVALKYIS